MKIRNPSITIRSESSLTIKTTGLTIDCGYTLSENERYLLAFCDRNPSTEVMGHRSEGKGFYFLIHDDSIAVQGQLERPNDGKVSDNGTFVFNDWLFDAATQSIGYCFGRTGEILLRWEFGANLHTNAISRSGKFVLFQTYNSDNSDGNNLYFFDLESASLIWEKKCDFEWPAAYHISEERKKIDLHYGKMGPFSLDWEGNMLDRGRYDLQFIGTLTGNRIVYESIKLIKSMADEPFIELLKKGLDDDATGANTKATGYKFLGELHEAEDLKFARDCYERALHFNPKIGLKKRLVVLIEKLTADGDQNKSSF